MASITDPVSPRVSHHDGITSSDTQQVQRSLIFRVANRTYGCDIQTLCAVVRLNHITRLPGAPSYVLGLINERGNLVTVIDAGAYLHGTPSDQKTGSVMMVDMGRGRIARPVGILVDDVIDVQVVREPIVPEERGYEPINPRAMLLDIVALVEEE